MVPHPSVSFEGQCSVINNNILYVYSPEAFQSIELSEGAQWKELEYGTSVRGAACVRVIPNGDASQAALYVVGGVVDPSVTNYTGLQRFTFATQKWEWITPADLSATQNRQFHAATFLNTTSQILIYSGSTIGSTTPSSETFLVSALPPYAVDARTSFAPPVVSPLLIPWNDSHAVTLGGDPNNKQVYTFGPTEGWQDTGATLEQGIADQTTTQCTVVFGDDGSKVLETYDMGVSPNEVTRVALLNAGGAVASPGETVGPPKKRRRRDLTIKNWPAYNDTFAPKTTRSGYSIAQDANDRAVIVGGNTQDPFCIFDQRDNTWINATALFSGESQQIRLSSTPSSSPSTRSASTTAAATSSASSTVAPTAATGSSDDKSRMLTVLGATLGAIFGIAAILLIVLLLLRWKREKRKRAIAEGYVGEKDEDRMSFADRGAPEFMSETGGSTGKNFYNGTNNTSSQTSLAIFQGRHNGHKRGIGPLGSDASTAGLVKKPSPLGYSDAMEMKEITIYDDKPNPYTYEKIIPRTEQSPPTVVHDPAPPAAGGILGRTRSSGWSRYFANNEATNLAHMPSGRSTYASDRTSNASQSEYTNSRVISQPSQTVPPLDLNFSRFDGQRLSRVATGSPTLGNSREDLRGTGIAVGQPMQAELARANSVGSSRSSIDGHDPAFSSGTNTGGETSTWTPVSRNDWYQRPPSSNYTTSVRDGTSSYYPNDGTSSFYPKSGVSSMYPTNSYHNPGRVPDPNEGRDSTVTIFPRGISTPVNEQRDAGGGPPKKPVGHQDMSWLNLGAMR